ncbi:MAG: NAD(P)-binding protein [Myxococcota bacterium]
MSRPGNSRPRVVVVEAGIAGLRAATLLARRDFEVVVLEARAGVGGRATGSGRPDIGWTRRGPCWAGATRASLVSRGSSVSAMRCCRCGRSRRCCCTTASGVRSMASVCAGRRASPVCGPGRRRDCCAGGGSCDVMRRCSTRPRPSARRPSTTAACAIMSRSTSGAAPSTRGSRPRSSRPTVTTWGSCRGWRCCCMP